MGNNNEDARNGVAQANRMGDHPPGVLVPRALDRLDGDDDRGLYGN